MKHTSSFLFVTAAWLVVAAMACETHHVVTPPEVVTYTDGGVTEWPSEQVAKVPVCVRACVKLAALGCPEARTPDGGLSCYAVCEKAELTGLFTLRPKCIAEAAGQESVRACATVRCRL